MAAPPRAGTAACLTYQSRSRLTAASQLSSRLALTEPRNFNR
jgi:hypothetical protein